MNSIQFIGNLGQDPKLFDSDKDKTPMASVPIGITTKYIKDGENQTTWVNLTVYGNQAKTLSEYTKKGSKVGVVGSFEMKMYKNKEGVEKESLSVTASNITLLDSKEK